MIYTVTLNPSLDYVIALKEFQAGGVNRAAQERILPGGKGLNVSQVLKELGMESTALGFLAGFTGKEIDRMLKAAGCRTDFIWLEEGFSRINVKLKEREESELNGRGPEIGPEDLEALLWKLDQAGKDDAAVLAGSIPKSLPDTVYQEIMERFSGRGLRFAVDAEGMPLKRVLPCRPFLIKPNRQELAGLFGTSVENAGEAAEYARRLQREGARNVLVSLGGEGAVLAAENGKIYQCPAPAGQVRNSVGAGDSMVAGFLAGYLRTGDYRAALETGVAAGSATAFSDGLAGKEKIWELLQEIRGFGGKEELK